MAVDAIHIDIDGVLVDFARGVCSLLQIDHDAVPWVTGVDPSAMFGSDTWTRIAQHGARWWQDLPEAPGAIELWARCSEFAPTYAVSSLPPHAVAAAFSAAGKHRWLERRFGARFKNVICGPVKLSFSRPGSVLIDDDDLEVNAFTRFGGRAILWPNPWNSAGDVPVPERLARVVEHLRRLASVPRTQMHVGAH